MFAVLCLVVFALLSLSTALSGARLSEKSAESTAAYYAADTQAERVHALLRSGEIPDGLSGENGIYYYDCPIGSSSRLSLELRQQKDGSWEVLRWQSVPAENWESDDSMPVWKGDTK